MASSSPLKGEESWTPPLSCAACLTSRPYSSMEVAALSALLRASSRYFSFCRNSSLRLLSAILA